jgi:putative FmdB family regulatory protein
VPLYEFRCSSCNEDFEELTSSHAVAPPCPRCGGREVERRLSQVAPTPRIGLRGRAARESDARRKAREEQRRQKRAK